MFSRFYVRLYEQGGTSTLAVLGWFYMPLWHFYSRVEQSLIQVWCEDEFVRTRHCEPRLLVLSVNRATNKSHLQQECRMELVLRSFCWVELVLVMLLKSWIFSEYWRWRPSWIDRPEGLLITMRLGLVWLEIEVHVGDPCAGFYSLQVEAVEVCSQEFV